MTIYVYDPDNPKASVNGMVAKEDRLPVKVHYVQADLKPYRSPVTRKVVDGRRERREDLKRTGSREVDPSEWKPNPKTTAQLKAEQAVLAERSRTPFAMRQDTYKRLTEGR
jgi:hypothetical protein